LQPSVYRLPAASLGKENPLPDLKGAGDAHAKIVIDTETVSPKEARYMGWARLNSILPYTLQDGYIREKTETAMPSIELENEHLKAVFFPTLGGRLWSLFDKDAGRELLHCNPVFQPANLALRNAWFSGGVEWNCGIIGHSPFTCDDMACEEVRLSDGTPVLRMYAYERVRHLFYRVEALLPDGARELYVRVRIDNALKQDTAVYWWSNMAVNEGKNIRVIVPAQKAFRYGYGGKLSKVPVPYMDAEADKLRGSAARLARENGGILHWDVSHSTCLPQSMDFFFDVPDTARPFIAAVDEDGYGMCQTSTPEFRGRKLFVWGMGEGGRHWQAFLSAPESAYIELQSGLARTQLEHLPMAAGESISWLESYGAVHADGKTCQGQNWQKVVDAVASALERRCPEERLEALHAQIQRELDKQPGHVLHEAQGFALCEKALLQDAFDTAGLSLDALRLGPAEESWMSLAKTGVFPCPDPLAEPLSYQISPAWEQALKAAVEKKSSDHWYAQYQLAVMAHYRSHTDEAGKEYRLSLERAENPWALRGLSLLDTEKAPNLLLRAAYLKPIRPLVIEAMEALEKAGRRKEMLAFYADLPEKLKKDGRVTVYYAAALLRTGKIDAAENVLQGPIVLTDVREGNTLLTDLWFEAAAIRHAGKADAESLAWAEEHIKPPKHLDFRML
ncbi:MAG: DUF5107 domain-containing protein, partial [Clostridia bacterium]|nr:DUF5107 domain-containing protein [Clostridia bacterium]